MLSQWQKRPKINSNEGETKFLIHYDQINVEHANTEDPRYRSTLHLLSKLKSIRNKQKRFTAFLSHRM